MWVAADTQLTNARRALEDFARDAGLETPSWTVDLDIIKEVPAMVADQEAGTDPVDLANAEAFIRDQAKGLAGDTDRIKELEKALDARNAAKREQGVRDWYQRKDTPFDGVRDARQAEAELQRLKRQAAGLQLGMAMLDAFKEERLIAAQLRDRELAEQAARDNAVALASRVAALLHDGVDDGGCVRAAFRGTEAQLRDREAERAEHRRQAANAHARWLTARTQIGDLRKRAPDV
ncbi:hypothetical protein DSM112329_04761 [Paraconexibacter sp. AEG42_29]|uniref:Uncharacterized protein n=2 Tax=Paraconexibacter sp. AEG42_29 TaxID=2997339 RepID=A0AAU7B1S2_9ACTN